MKAANGRCWQLPRIGVLAIAAFPLLCGATTGPLSGQQKMMRQSSDVVVQNNRDVPVTVYFEDGLFDVKLGTVEALRIATLPLPERALERQDLRFLVHPRRGPDLEGEAFDIRDGVHLGLVIPDRPGGWSGAPTDEKMTAVLSDTERGEATVTVENERPADDVVFIDWGSFESRLGTVRGMSTETFPIPRSLVGRAVEIVIRPGDGQELESAPLTVHADTHLGVRVPAV